MIPSMVFLRSTLSLGLSLLALSCASTPRMGEVPIRENKDLNTVDQSATLPAREAKEYREIHGLYMTGNFEGLLPKAQAFEKRYPRSKQVSAVYNLHGLANLALKRPVDAIPLFRTAIATSASPTFNQFVLYNRATAEFEAGHLEDAHATLSEIRPEVLDRQNRAKYHFLRSQVFQSKSLNMEAAREALMAGRAVEDGSPLKAQVQARMDESLQQLADLGALETLYQEFDNTVVTDTLLFYLGSKQIAQGKRDAGSDHLKMLAERYPKSMKVPQASEMLRSVLESEKAVSNAIGVLLPMHGRFAKFGTRTLQGIELALRVFNVNEPASKYSIILEDSGETPEQALRALDKLYYKHRVIAVIGPLLSKGIEQVTQRAQELGLPLVSLAQMPGVTAENVFLSGMTPEMQAGEIARHAVEKMGLKRFAILHPRDKFGEQMSQQFWDAVESLGGKIVGIESYPPGETDHRHAVDKLSGLYYTDARKKELEELAQLRELHKIKRRNRKTEQYFALKPIVEYEAVFIPDEPKVVGQILPTFAYRDVDKVKFLGISTWNSPELIKRGQNYAEGAVFVDAFFPESTAPAIRKFVERYRATYNQDPGALEALAFDAANIIEYALNSLGLPNRSELRAKLRDIKNFHGVTGRITFKGGHYSRDLYVLTVQNKKITEVR